MIRQLIYYDLQIRAFSTCQQTQQPQIELAVSQQTSVTVAGCCTEAPDRLQSAKEHRQRLQAVHRQRDAGWGERSDTVAMAWHTTKRTEASAALSDTKQHETDWNDANAPWGKVKSQHWCKLPRYGVKSGPSAGPRMAQQFKVVKYGCI